MNKTIAILNTSAPFAQANAKDALDLALILGSYEQKVSLFFQGDGVYQLTAQQNPELIGQKDFIKTFAALEFYDIEHIYVSKSCLQTRQLAEPLTITNASLLTDTEFANKLSACHITFRF